MLFNIYANQRIFTCVISASRRDFKGEKSFIQKNKGLDYSIKKVIYSRSNKPWKVGYPTYRLPAFHFLLERIYFKATTFLKYILEIKIPLSSSLPPKLSTALVT